jgi:hypothetical protein
MTAFNIALGAGQWAQVQRNISLRMGPLSGVDKLANAFQVACKVTAPPPDAAVVVTVEMNRSEAGAVINGLTAEPPVHPKHDHFHFNGDLFVGGLELTANQERIRDRLEAEHNQAVEVHERRYGLAEDFLSAAITHINGKPFATDAEERAYFADGFTDKIRNIEEIIAQEHRDEETREHTRLEIRRRQVADEAKRAAEAEEQASTAGALAEALLLTTLDLTDLDHMPAMQWLVDCLYPAGGLNFLAGAPKTGKSFAAISLGLHVAAGKTWHMLNVQQGAVVYVCAEGASGIGKRVAAARREYNIEAATPFYMFRPFNLADAGDVAVFIEMVRRKVNGQRVALVIFDTLSRMIPGQDENSAGAMSPVIHNLTAITDRLYCATLTVHHTGANAAKGMRGSTVLTGAADSVVILHGRDGGVGPAKLVCSHLKDGATGAEVLVNFAAVNEGEDTETLVMRDRAPTPDRGGVAPVEAEDGVADWEGPADAAGWLGGLEALLQETGQHGATGAEWFGHMFPADGDDRRAWRARWCAAADRMVKSGKLRRDGALFVLAG